jgi:hypothetical protein
MKNPAAACGQTTRAGPDHWPLGRTSGGRLSRRHQGCRRGAYPIRQRRDIEIDVFGRIDVALAVERRVQPGTWRRGYE